MAGKGPVGTGRGMGTGRRQRGGYDNFRAGGYEVLQDGYGSYYGGRGGEGSIGAVVISEGVAEGGGRHTGATIGGVELCTGVVGPGTVHIHPRQL